MMEQHIIGAAAIVIALAVAVFGYRLGRRYGAAIAHTGIGRAYPARHSALAFLGDALVIVGLIGVLMAVMLAFT